MLTTRDLILAFEDLGLRKHPVIAHASLKAFGEVQGGAQALLGAVLDSVGALVMPTFTYKTMVTPEVGPPNNGLVYGTDHDLNRMAEPYRSNMPADRLMGILPETLRNHPHARRTRHPILSFAGINADEALLTQTLYDPLAPIGKLCDMDGWALLLGVDQTVNTSIHYAEKLAGRRTFIRWAMLPNRIVECPGFPGCSGGFDALARMPDLPRAMRRVQVGNTLVQAMPLWGLFDIVQHVLKKDPLALLCDREDCGRCNAMRNA
jgi:aminoglycoside 3-N-acetyltransferase